jgi:hypothetical protein
LPTKKPQNACAWLAQSAKRQRNKEFGSSEVS